jgi:enoyl-CoA hydratase/carnithine racemase
VNKKHRHGRIADFIPREAMMASVYQQIAFEQGDDHVATITINRPEKLNTFTDVMADEFADAWGRVRDDDAIHAVVLRATRQSRAFSVGIDVGEGMEMLRHANVWRQSDPGEKLGPKQNKLWKPVICALHGLVAAGAFYWLNEADITICADDTQFFDPHVTFGMVAALEPIGLTRRIALGEVMRIALMGSSERVTAETALRIGLVSEITTPDALHARAHELAAIIAAQPSAATQGTVRAIWESLDMGRTAAIAHAVRYWQVGNPAGQAEIDRAAMPKIKWNPR